MYASGTHRLAAFLPESYLHSSGGAAQNGKDPMTILTSRDFEQLGPTTHMESRHTQNFDLEETILELGPLEILKRSRTQSSERRLQENNRALRSR
ncbi:hypothetical protein M514_11580 [Trichuris suis]|uniref:Uncharacterized protein n=2 Tax=Trichuris suis TaxID=68888 RepID=A0A085MU44_9BILA|nr:hypothetical protein M514_11580 [Trichuris suis]